MQSRRSMTQKFAIYEMTTAQLVELRAELDAELGRRIGASVPQNDVFRNLSEQSGVVTTSRDDAAWLQDNISRSEKAQILSDPRPEVRDARWHAYVDQHRALDAKREELVTDVTLDDAETVLRR